MIKLTAIEDYLLYISNFSGFIPLILFALNYKKLSGKGLKVFFIYTCYIFVHTMATILLRYFTWYYTYTLLLRFFNVIELGFISYFIYLNIKNATAKKVILAIQPLFFIYCLFDYLSSKQPSVGFYPAAVECIIMIAFIIYFFFEMMQEIIQTPLYTIMEFWLATAILLYFSGNFFLFVYSKTMIKEEGFLVTYKYIYSSIIILKNIFISISVIFLNSTLASLNQHKKSLSEESLAFFQEL